MAGVAGEAIEVIASDGDYDENPAWSATVGTWFLDCPGQAAAWRYYVLNIIHLRPIEGTPEPEVNIPGATHQIFLFALNPERNPVPLDFHSWHPLTPLNFQDQFQLPSDEAAKVLIEMAANAVVEGVLWAEPPLSGQREPWLTSMLQTSAHLRGEDHPCDD